MNWIDNVVRTVKSTSIVLALNLIFDFEPSDEQASNFVSEMLQVLVDKEVTPDAVGYYGPKFEVTLTYHHLAELGQVHKALRDTVILARKWSEREERRKKLYDDLVGKHGGVFDSDRFKAKE